MSVAPPGMNSVKFKKDGFSQENTFEGFFAKCLPINFGLNEVRCCCMEQYFQCDDCIVLVLGELLVY